MNKHTAGCRCYLASAAILDGITLAEAQARWNRLALWRSRLRAEIAITPEEWHRDVDAALRLERGLEQMGRELGLLDA